MEYDFEIKKLSELFYDTYSNPPHVEIIRKKNRSYNCIVIDSKYDYFICIPYRSNINHRYSYKFTSSVRSQNFNSGLDYTKMVIIDNYDFFSDEVAIIDTDEYLETIANIDKIASEANKFLDDYIDYERGRGCLSKEEFKRRYQYSPLKYFHAELKIKEPVVC